MSSASGPRKSHTYSSPVSTQTFATDVKHLNHQVRHIDGSRSVAQDARVSEHGLRNHMPHMPSTLLSLPAPAERLVKLYKALELVAAVLRQRELGAEQRTLVVEDLEVGGDAAAVAFQ